MLIIEVVEDMYMRDTCALLGLLMYFCLLVLPLEVFWFTSCTSDSQHLSSMLPNGTPLNYEPACFLQYLP